MTFIVTADYRPNNPNKPTYYVRAENKRECKKKFERWFPWLKVYDVQEFDGVLGDDDWLWCE